MRIRGKLNRKRSMLRRIEIFLKVRQKLRTSVVSIGQSQGVEECLPAQVGDVPVQLIEIHLTRCSLLSQQVVNAGNPTSRFAAELRCLRCSLKRLELLQRSVQWTRCRRLPCSHVDLGVDQIHFFLFPLSQ